MTMIAFPDLGVSAATDVEWLIDNANTFDALLAAIANARETIWISQLAFDPDCRAYGDFGGLELLDALVEAAQTRDVVVKILLNETLLLDTATALRKVLRARHCTGVDVRGIQRFPQLLHAKLVIVDGDDAFVVGSPFVNGYWDDETHEPVDPRRPARELGGRPMHDLTTRVRGHNAFALSAFFAELWNEASVGDGPCDELAVPAVPADHAVVCTVPTRLIPGKDAGTTDIASAIERAIASAERLIYIEHQYLSSTLVIEALRRALEREPDLEIVIVLNQNPDVTAYRGWQNVRLEAAGLLAHPRVGLFTLWRAKPDESGTRWICNQVFVHSKVLLVDDECAITGSANLDGVSLHSYGADFTGWLGERVFRDVRNVDVALVCTSSAADPDGCVRYLRERLWSEHLGTSCDDVMREGLAAWRQGAREAIETLNAFSIQGSFDGAPRALVLPYSRQSVPSAQLRDIGVHDLTRIDLQFNPSWIERHLSPNWVRNMFG